jgi:hypothetical protein
VGGDWATGRIEVEALAHALGLRRQEHVARVAVQAGEDEDPAGTGTQGATPPLFSLEGKS